MGSVKVDSDLMTQHVAAVPVPHSSQFFAVRDEHGGPLLFSLGSNGVLFAFKESESGSRVRLDLNAAFGINGKKAVTFSVVQETGTENLYYGFAYRNSDNRSDTTLVMCRPFHPTALKTEGSFSLGFYMMRGTEAPKSSVARILLGPKHPTQHYPAALISYAPIHDVHNSADLARISVDSLQSEWRFHNDVELPENATEIVDVCAAALPVGTGCFVLYIIQGQTRLAFQGTPTASGFSFKVTLKPPPGARRLATIQQPNGYSGLLCGGNGLQFWTPTDAQKRDNPGRAVNATGLGVSLINGIDQLLVSQAPSLISVFVSTADSALAYFTTRALDFSETISPVILSRDPGNFAPFVAPDKSALQLIVATSDNKLSLLQQNTMSGIWTTMPFYTPSLTENIEYDAFFTRMTLRAADRRLLSQETFLLKCPDGWTEILVNGRSLVVGPDGVPVISDARGTLTLITPTDDISSPSFILTDAGPSFAAHLGGAEFTIYPDKKVIDKISTIRTGDDLRKAKLPDGTKVLEGSNASDNDIDLAAQTIAQLGDQRDNIASGASSRSSIARSLPDSDRRSFRVGRVRTGKDIKEIKIIAGVNAERILAAKSIVDVDWNHVKYWWEESQNSISAGIDTILDGAITFVMELGGEFVRLLVETVEQLAKTIALIVDKIVDAWEKFKQWVMFLLNFDDILRVKTQLKGLMDDGLSSLGPFFQNFAGSVGGAIDNMQNEFLSTLGLEETSATSGGLLSSEEVVLSEPNDLSESSGFGYVGYQMDHGGAANFTTLSSRASAASSRPLSSQETEKALQSLRKIGGTGDKKVAVAAAEDDLLEVIKSLSSDFDLKGNLTAAECGQKIASTVISAIFDGLEGILTTNLELIGEFFQTIRGILNAKINMPIFSALYKSLTGSELTLLDALCLICAIPITVVTKILGVWDKFAVLDELNVSELFTLSLATLSGVPEKRVTTKRSKDEEEEHLRGINTVFGIINCAGRFFKICVAGIGISERAGKGTLRTLDIQATSEFSQKQTVQFSKVVSVHPLAALAAGAGDGSISIDALRVNQAVIDVDIMSGLFKYLGGPLGLIDLGLSLVNLVTSFPLEPDAPNQPARRIGWVSSIISELASAGNNDPTDPDGLDDNGKRTLVRILCTFIGFTCAVVVNVNDIRIAEENNEDFDKRVAICHLVECILDLAAAATGIFADEAKDVKVKMLSIVCDFMSWCFLVGTTKASKDHEEWNYVVCPTR